MRHPARAKLVGAHQAYDTHEWETARSAFAEADSLEPLDAADLECWAWATGWSGHSYDQLDLFERCQAAYASSGDRRAEARLAVALTHQNGFQGNRAVAAGWWARAYELLEGLPECSDHGRLQWLTGSAAEANDREDARGHYEEALAIGRRTGDLNVEAMAKASLGHLLVSEGRVVDGLALLDEAMGLAMSAGLEPSAASWVYCAMMWTCRTLGDLRRAGEWTEASTRWCEREGLASVTGVCRVHRAELSRIQGELDQAEHDARLALEEFGASRGYMAGFAYQELGEVLRRRGDHEGAAEAFQQAAELGRDPQPGLARLWLSQGDADGALRALEAALTGPSQEAQDERPFLLPALVTAAVATGELERAAIAVDEMNALAEALSTGAHQAAAAGARGELALASGRIAEAHEHLHRAWQGWSEVGAPYEAAQAQVLLARAYLADDDPADARLGLTAARGCFERLGAARDAAMVGDLLTELDERSRAVPVSRAIRTFVFTDIVASTRLVEALGDEAWESLLRWHDRTLLAIVDEHHGEEVKHEGDGFFLAFPDVDRALSCVIAIQQALGRHREEHGFAPPVRIGVHAGEATHRDDDYTGLAIHQAARIGSAAHDGEILVSAETLDAAADDYDPSNRRELTLKGLARPVEVATIRY